MLAPSKPNDEAARIRALKRLDLLDTPNEEAFDRITRLAQALLDVPIALVSLIDDERQWFKSCVGYDASQGDRDASFCGHAILEDEVFVINDARRDPRFADNPFVTGDPFIRFYAGVPIRTAGGHKVGTLCVLDRQPRQLREVEQARLVDLANLVERELTIRLSALTDPLTGALNRRLFDDLLEQEVARARRLGTDFSLVCFDIDDFKSLNDTHGHAAGDAVLARVAAACRHTIRATDTLFRIGGEEFVVFLPAASADAAAEVAERLRGVVARQRVMLEGIPELSVTISLGVAALDAANTTPKVLLARGDDAMYAAKKAGRDRVSIHNAEM